MKKFIVVLLISCFLFSCANSKDLNIEGKMVTVEPCGWIDMNDCKRDDVVYDVCVGNVVWSGLTVQTLIIPVLLTGYQLWEPVRVKSVQSPVITK